MINRRAFFNTAVGGAVVLGLAACGKGGDVIDPGTGGGSVVDQIIARVNQACAFVPYAKSVLDVIASFGGLAIPGIVLIVANAICSSVDQAKAVRSTKRRGPASVVVNGVVVQGTFR